MRLDRRSLLAAAAVGGMVYVGVVGVAPALTTRIAERNLRKPVDLVSAATPRYAGPVIQVSPVIQVHVPAILRAQYPDRVSIYITKTILAHEEDLPGGGGTSVSDQPLTWDTTAVDKSFEVTLSETQGLVIEPQVFKVSKKFTDPRSLSEPALSWNWSLSANAPGRPKLLIGGLPVRDFPLGVESGAGATELLSFGGPRKRRDPLPDWVRTLPDGTVEITIETLTQIGLTASQDAWFKVIKAVASSLGVVLAYPFVAAYFRKREGREKPPGRTHVRRPPGRTPPRAEADRRAERSRRLR